MHSNLRIHSSSFLNFEAFVRFISLNDTLELLCDIPTEHGHAWYFYRPSSSTTFYTLTYQKPRTYILSMDDLASVEDYKLFPYLADSLAHFLEGSIEETNRENTIYQILNEEWMEGAIADEIARLKGSLTIFPKYYIHQSLQGAAYVSVDTLRRFGVTLTSATPRIYGYIQYMMQHNLLPVSTAEEIKQESQSALLKTHEEYDVEIPQHRSIGRVKSWQLNGEETFESYSREDVDLLLLLANNYLTGEKVEGVVLNDIGTIYQEGIGVAADASIAAEWFQRAYNEGDSLYAPTNMGDLYRKGGVHIKKSLAKALEYYQKSTDPYAFYRIGQAYEEGWVDTPNPDKAMIWYKKAAEAGHHLGIKKLNEQK